MKAYNLNTHFPYYLFKTAYFTKKNPWPQKVHVLSTLLLSFGLQVPLESVCLIDKYSWLEVEKNLGEDLLQRLAKNMTVPLVVIR
jgi:hypothetical protein